MLETSRWLTLPAALGLAACGGPGPAGPDPPPPPSPTAFEALISNSASQAGGIVYVSLRPGAVANGQSATIENRRTGEKVGVTIVAGGFDPATIAAGAGDTLRIEIRTGDTSPPLVAAFPVPTQQGLLLVRTDPHPGSRDVALDPDLRVILSEPVDPATASSAAVQLRANGAPVDGTVEIDPGAPWVVRFIPAANLAPDATYQLVATTSLRDRDGAPLESDAEAEFTTEPAPVALPDARLAFVSTRDGGGPAAGYRAVPWIYLAHVDGSEATRLTRGAAPAWSPDGRRLAFHRWSGGALGDGEPQVVIWDGSGFRTLVTGGYYPAWSPDGTLIAYNTGVGVSGAGIYVANADGPPNPRKLIDYSFALPDDGYGPGWVGFPVWSPDGSRMAFVRANYGIPWTMYLMNADGSEPSAVSLMGSLGDTPPAWSPDGTRLLAMMQVGPGPGWSIASFDPDGGDLRLHASGTWVADPEWSPDGANLLYVAFAGPATAEYPVGTRARIYITSVESPSPRQLVPEAVAPALPDYWDTEPAWSRAPAPIPNTGRDR